MIATTTTTTSSSISHAETTVIISSAVPLFNFVEYTIHMVGVTFLSFQSPQKQAFISLLASMLAQPTSSIVVTDVRAGSVILSFTLQPFSAEMDCVVQALKADTTLQDSLRVSNSLYSSLELTWLTDKVQCINCTCSSLSAASASSTTSSSASLVIGIAVGAAILVVLIVVVVIVVRRRRYVRRLTTTPITSTDSSIPASRRRQANTNSFWEDEFGGFVEYDSEARQSSQRQRGAKSKRLSTTEIKFLVDASFSVIKGSSDSQASSDDSSEMLGSRLPSVPRAMPDMDIPARNTPWRAEPLVQESGNSSSFMQTNTMIPLRPSLSIFSETFGEEEA
jgi:hypothetical protein